MRTLIAGQLSAQLVDGELRYVHVHGHELVRRIAVVVRDVDWGTLETSIDLVDVDTSNGFEARVRATCRRGDVEVDWTARFASTPDGVECDVELVPRRSFAYNRMGLTVLHAPHVVAGCAFRAEGPSGTVDGILPELVGPQPVVDGLPRPLFPPFDVLDVDDRAGARQTFAFTGELFEMEDQRNWADGSFKTYAMPLGRGFPLQAQSDAPIRQSVRVSARGIEADGAAADDGVKVRIGPRRGRLPSVGTALPARPDPTRVETALAALRPRHLRVDALDAELAIALGVPLELAIVDEQGVRRAAEQRAALTGRLARVLLLDEARDEAELVRDLFPGVPTAIGSTGHFADLNRDPPADPLDGLAFQVSPQAHLFDDDTLRESLESLEAVVLTARAIGADRPVHVSPLSLRPAHGPGSEPRAGADAGTDPRQTERFAASWTLAAVAKLGAGGAASVTAHELYGLRGACDSSGRAHPIAAVLADLAGHAGEPLRVTTVSHPLAVAALATDAGDGMQVRLANLTGNPVPVMLPDLGRQVMLAPFAAELLGEPDTNDGLAGT